MAREILFSLLRGLLSVGPTGRGLALVVG